MANQSICKRLDDLQRAADPTSNLIRVCIDWGDTVDYNGVIYTKAEWEAIKAQFGFDDQTTIRVNYDDRDPGDQDDLSPIRSP